MGKSASLLALRSRKSVVSRPSSRPREEGGAEGRVGEEGAEEAGEGAADGDGDGSSVCDDVNVPLPPPPVDPV